MTNSFHQLLILHVCFKRTIKYPAINRPHSMSYCFTCRVFLHRVKIISRPQEVRDRPLQLYRHRRRGRRLHTQSNHCSVRLEFSILTRSPSERERFNVRCMNLFWWFSDLQCVYSYESMWWCRSGLSYCMFVQGVVQYTTALEVLTSWEHTMCCDTHTFETIPGKVQDIPLTCGVTKYIYSVLECI